MQLRRDLEKACEAMVAIRDRNLTREKQFLIAYIALYARAVDREDDWEQAAAHFELYGDDTKFVRHIMKAIPDKVDVRGWRAIEIDGNRIIVEREGIRGFIVRDDGFVNVDEEVICACSAVIPGRLPGFLSRSSGDPSSVKGVYTRYYINIDAGHAVWALGALSRDLEEQKIPYLLKVFAHPRSYQRKDACVVFVPKRAARRTLDIILASMLKHSIAPKAGVPLLTGAIHPGLAMAEQPSQTLGTPWSYGLWVTGLLMEASNTGMGTTGLVTEVRRLIREEGRDPDHPYLCPTPARKARV